MTLPPSAGDLPRISDLSAPRERDRCRAEEPAPGFDPEQMHRCPGCGGMVYRWPCLGCQLRALRAA